MAGDQAAPVQEEEHDTIDRNAIFTNYKSIWSRNFGVSLVVEFVGTMLFQVIGGGSKPELAPFVNGFALMAWIYTAADISGGHLNPAVTVAVYCSGHFPLLHTGIYILLQILGAICGALILSGLVPGAEVGSGKGPGCFDRNGAIGPNVTDAQVFGWELIMTFTLISCVYACGISKPGHGSHTPFAVGMALLACAGSGGQYTGGALNPARVLGPRIVYGCGTEATVEYMCGQFLAAPCACLVHLVVSGAGPLNPHMARKALPGLSRREAFYVWITGAPPERFRKTGRENIMDMLLETQIVSRVHQDYIDQDAAQERQRSVELVQHGTS